MYVYMYICIYVYKCIDFRLPLLLLPPPSPTALITCLPSRAAASLRTPGPLLPADVNTYRSIFDSLNDS